MPSRSGNAASTIPFRPTRSRGCLCRRRHFELGRPTSYAVAGQHGGILARPRPRGRKRISRHGLGHQFRCQPRNHEALRYGYSRRARTLYTETSHPLLGIRPRRAQRSGPGRTPGHLLGTLSGSNPSMRLQCETSPTVPRRWQRPPTRAASRLLRSYGVHAVG